MELNETSPWMTYDYYIYADMHIYYFDMHMKISMLMPYFRNIRFLNVFSHFHILYHVCEDCLYCTTSPQK